MTKFCTQLSASFFQIEPVEESTEEIEKEEYDPSTPTADENGRKRGPRVINVFSFPFKSFTEIFQFRWK